MIEGHDDYKNRLLQAYRESEYRHQPPAPKDQYHGSSVRNVKVTVTSTEGIIDRKRVHDRDN